MAATWPSELGDWAAVLFLPADLLTGVPYK